jgi:hypothetical protein
VGALACRTVLFERLKRNGIIFTAGDGMLGWSSVNGLLSGITIRVLQKFARNFSVGNMSFTRHGESVARSTGAPILPVFCVAENKEKVVVVIEPAINVATEPARPRFTSTVSPVC